MTQAAKRNAALRILRADNLQFPWLVHGFSTRTGGFSRAYGRGDLNLGFTRDDARAAVERNRAAFLDALGARGWPLITLRQIHSDLIHLVDSVPTHPLTGDGLVTDTPGLLLAAQSADCLPVILADAKKKAIGVFHAGWRGTLKRIVEKGVGVMRSAFGSDPVNLRAAIGPGIRPCCYEVGEEVRDRFRSQFSYADDIFRQVEVPDPVREKYPLLFLTARAPGHGPVSRKLYLDLAEATRRQLLDAGLRPRHIAALPHCTACDTAQFFSYRAAKRPTGRLLGVAGTKKPGR